MFIPIFLITLLILVLTHEFGHFIVAKKFGIKVLEFGFGIPPRIWGKKIGETLVSLNLLPFGGFVRLLGEDETDTKVLGDPRSFASQAVWKRIMVVVAGVVMNLVLAWILFYTVIIAQGFQVIYPTMEPVVVVADVVEGLPADMAGVKRGELVAAIDSQPAGNIEQATAYIKSRPQQKILLNLSDLEGKTKRTVEVTPKQTGPNEGLIGVAFSPIPFKQYESFSEKLFSGITYSWNLTKLTIAGLGKLFSDLLAQNYQKASESVAGPVGLVAVTRDIVGLGAQAVLPYLWFMGVICLTLAIFNILPVPALDGGRLVFLLYELVAKRKVDPVVEKLIHTAGMVLLLALIALITFSDIKKILQ